MADQVKLCKHTDDLMELRVHGAGDTPLEELLGKGEYTLIRGDEETAGFYRRDDVSGIEAYSWGKFTHRQKSRAFWVLLAPFTLANLSGWLVSQGRWTHLTGSIKAMVRLMALGLTMLFVLWLGTIAVDTAALQCGGQELCADRQIWLRFFNSDFFTDQPARRLVVGMIVPVLITTLLVVLAGWRSADAYERYQNKDADHPDATISEDNDHPLRDGSLWRTFHSVRGLALLHTAATLAAIAAAGGFGLWRISRGVEGGGLWDFFSDSSAIHIVVYAALAILVVTAIRVTTDRVPHNQPSDEPTPWFWAWGLLGIGAAAVVVVALFGLLDTYKDSSNLLSSYWGFGYMSLALGSIVVALLLPLFVLAWASGRRDVAYNGFGPLVTMALGVVIASALVAGTIQWASDWLGDSPETAVAAADLGEATKRLQGTIDGSLPSCAIGGCSDAAIRNAADNYVVTLDGVRQAPISVPTGFDIFSVLILCVMILIGLYVLWLEFWKLRIKLIPHKECPPAVSHAAQIDAAAARSVREVRRWRKGIARDTRTSPRNTRIHRAAGWLLLLAAAPAAIFLVDFWWLDADAVDAFAEWLQGDGAWLLKASRWAIAAAVVAAGVYVQRAYSNPTKRRALGGVWDVATFWPRVYHPFAPPTYSARAVPELRARIKELLRPDPTTKRERRLVVSSHSQGVPITMAVLAQLEKDELRRVAFLSHGSPTGALYGAFFPEYYGPAPIKQLGDLLTDEGVGEGATRWTNIWRITDWTGGYAFPPPRRSLDLTEVDCRTGVDYTALIAAGPGSPPAETAAMKEVAAMAARVEKLWCDPHHDVEILPGNPLPPSEGHHTYLTDKGYLVVCKRLRKLLRPSKKLSD